MRIFFLILWAHQRVYSKKELGTLKLNTYKNAKVLDIFQRGALDLVLEFMHRKFGLETKQALGHLVQSVLNCETLFKACHVPKALYPRYTHIATPFSQARLTHMLLILSNIMFGREE